MKKRSLLILVMLQLLSILVTQAQPGFSAYQGTFNSIVGISGTTTPTAPSIGTSDDGAYNNLPLGFTFYFNGVGYTSVSASTNGWMCFGNNIGVAAPYGKSNSLIGNATTPFMAPLWDDLSLASGSFSYRTDGTAPSRIFTAEWLSAKWSGAASNPNISFQVKIYEWSGVGYIEYIYKPESGGLNNPSATIGFFGGAASGAYISLDNSTAIPVISSSTYTSSILSKPNTGQIYRFQAPFINQSVSVSSTVNTTSTIFNVDVQSYLYTFPAYLISDQGIVSSISYS